jgi:hypothetical protein
VAGTGGDESAGERAADEAADAGDENTHEAEGLRGFRRVGRGIFDGNKKNATGASRHQTALP